MECLRFSFQCFPLGLLWCYDLYLSLLSHTGQNGHHKQSNKQQMLERLWRKGALSALLVGMQTGEATVENSMEFPQKTKNGTAFRPSNSATGRIP